MKIHLCSLCNQIENFDCANHQPPTAYALVSRARGSWKYQDAFAIAKCVATLGKDGLVRWRTIGYAISKFANTKDRLEEYVQFYKASKTSLHNTLVKL